MKPGTVSKLIPALAKQRQTDLWEFKASPVYIARPSGATEKPCLKITKTITTNKICIHKELFEIKSNLTYIANLRVIKETVKYLCNRSLSSLQRLIINNNMKYLWYCIFLKGLHVFSNLDFNYIILMQPSFRIQIISTWTTAGSPDPQIPRFSSPLCRPIHILHVL